MYCAPQKLHACPRNIYKNVFSSHIKKSKSMAGATILAAILISQRHLTRIQARFLGMIIVFDLLCVFLVRIPVLNLLLLVLGAYLLSQKQLWRDLYLHNAPMHTALLVFMILDMVGVSLIVSVQFVAWRMLSWTPNSYTSQFHGIPTSRRRRKK